MKFEVVKCTACNIVLYKIPIIDGTLFSVPWETVFGHMRIHIKSEIVEEED